ncbi:MAG: PLP-dependent transferase, partial [Rubrivivax sp.]
YESAGAADARFAGDDPGFVYSRYANPTTQMFEERLALLEGAEFCRAVASGIAGVFARICRRRAAGPRGGRRRRRDAAGARRCPGGLAA